MFSCLRWMVLGSLFATFCAFDLFVALAFDDNEDLIYHFTLGVCFAQMTILAVWTALGPASVFVRASTGIVLAALVSLSLLMIDDDSDPGMLAICCGVFGEWVLLQVPLWVVRLSFGWHVGLSESSLAHERKGTQIGVFQLLLWTGLVACILSIARFVVADSVSDLFSENYHIALLVLPLVFNALLAIALIWAAFARRWLWFWIGVSAICALASSIAEVRAFQFVSENVAPYAIMRINAFHYAVCCGSLLIIRWCGFHLVPSNGRTK